MSSHSDTGLELWLVDGRELVDAWTVAFEGLPGVHIHEGDILAMAENTLVSPANSFGWMDGGIDRLYTERFGIDLQRRLQDAISARPEGHLPVGAALFLRTGDPRIPFLISAPTMVNPGPVTAANSFFAMAAALKVAWEHRAVVRKVFCPGLATGIGEVAPGDAAREMAKAYRKWLARTGS